MYDIYWLVDDWGMGLIYLEYIFSIRTLHNNWKNQTIIEISINEEIVKQKNQTVQNWILAQQNE